jgi:uncharacterized protein (TIGR03546 family)
MLWLLNEFRKLLIALHSQQSLKQLAFGISLGFILGCLPKGLLFYTVFIILLFFDANKAIAIFTLFLITLFVPIFDPLLMKVGHFFLVEVDSLQPFWQTLYNTPFVPFTGFNNTLILGSFLVSLVLSIPVYFLAKFLLKRYRESMTEFINKHPLIQKFKHLKWVVFLTRFLNPEI